MPVGFYTCELHKLMQNKINTGGGSYVHFISMTALFHML